MMDPRRDFFWPDVSGSRLQLTERLHEDTLRHRFLPTGFSQNTNDPGDWPRHRQSLSNRAGRADREDLPELDVLADLKGADKRVTPENVDTKEQTCVTLRRRCVLFQQPVTSARVSADQTSEDRSIRPFFG
jgi:hypothetical protein